MERSSELGIADRTTSPVSFCEKVYSIILKIKNKTE